MELYFSTSSGYSFLGDSSQIAQSEFFNEYLGRVNLVFTSPPFPLNRKKKYGNLNGEKYINWLSDIVNSLTPFLAENGSVVIEVGNSWEKGNPEMSTLPLEALIDIKKKCGLHLCQSFIWYNTAKLPGPAEWVNIRRIRVKDSFTHIWWFSKSPNPKADNRRVLVEYSSSMKKLLKNKKYNSGTRPSEHQINEVSFLNNNEGAIPSNVLVSSNTSSNTSYQNYCKEHNLQTHPARMPKEIPEFFIKFLTDEGDIVLDPFAGSNTTGEASESLGREWISIEMEEEYIKGSIGRFSKVDYGTSISHL